METIDEEALRDYLLDYCGSAAMGGFPVAFLDLADIESADIQELCRIAERLGIDPYRF